MKFHKILIVFFYFANVYPVLLRNGADLPRDLVDRIYNTLLECDQYALNVIYYTTKGTSKQTDFTGLKDQMLLMKFRDNKIIDDKFMLTEEAKSVFLASIDKIVTDPKFIRGQRLFNVRNLICADIYLTSPISWKNYFFPKYWFKKQ